MNKSKKKDYKKDQKTSTISPSPEPSEKSEDSRASSAVTVDNRKKAPSSATPSSWSKKSRLSKNIQKKKKNAFNPCSLLNLLKKRNL